MVQKSLHKVIVLALILFVQFKAQSSLEINEIYVPTIYKNFESTSNTQYFKKIAVAKTVGLIYFKQGQNTIKILDEKDNFKLLCTFQSEGSLKENFLVTNDGKYLILINENYLTILGFDINTRTLKTLYKDTQQSQFSILSLNNLQDKIYLIRDQVNFQIISLVDFNFLKGTFDNQWQVLDMHISLDEKWLSLSANTLGLFFYQIKKLSNSTVEFINVSLYSNISFYQFLLIQNDNIIIGLDYWQGLSIFDLTTYKQQFIEGKVNIELNPIILNWWMVKDEFPYTSTIEISQEQKYIYVGARSLGIYVIDITNIINPLVFQLIQIQEDISQLALSYNLSYLYLSTKKSVIVYQQDKANLQMNYPNLYNKHQSKLSSILKTPYGWRSLLLKDDKTLIVTASNYGVVIAQFNQTSIQLPLNVLSTISYPFISYTDNIMLFRNETFLLVPVQDPAGYIMDIYDISNKTSPKLVQRIESLTSAYIYSMSKRSDETLFGCQNSNNLMFFSISGNIQFSLTSSFKIPQSLSNDLTNNMVILSGFPYVILLFRAQAISALDIRDIQNPLIASRIDSLGAEYIIQGTYLTNYCFVADGLQGISIIDLNQLPNIIIISNVQIKGYTNFLNLIMKDNFVITSQLSGGQLNLASISQIEQPKFISELQYKNEFAAAASISSDQTYLFAINSGGVRIIPTKANIFIHYEFSQVIKESTGVVNLIRLKQIDQILSVGQTIQITLNPLYPIQGSQITKAYFVRDGILYDIPSWMVFDIYQSTLTLSITKDSLQVVSSESQKNNEITKQTVVFATKSPLNQNSFIFTSEISGNIIINSDLSQQIFTAYKNMGIINHLNQVSDQFAEDETFSAPIISGLNLTDEAMIKIKSVLQMSLTYSPVDLLLQKSLKIDFSQDSEFISSYSAQASLLFTINQNDGKFVNRLYSSVVTSLSEKQEQIQFQGNIKSLNQLLQQKIQIYLFDKNKMDIQIQIQVNDGINHEYIQMYTFQDLPKILQIKKDISISDKNRLQNQINSQFTGSQILIDSQVDIEFLLDTYDGANFNDLQLQAFYLEGDEYLPLTSQQNEIQFTPQQFKFYIKTTTSDYGRKYCIAVNTTDSYSSIRDQFCVTASVISFLIFLNIFIQVLGPILFFLGVFKYWNKFFNMLFNKRNLIGKILIEEDKQFVLKLIVINDSFLIGQKLFNEFIKTIQLKSISQRNIQINLQSPHNTHNSSLLKSDILKLSLKRDELILNDEKEEIEISEIDFTKEQSAKARQIIEKTIRILKTKNFSSKEPDYKKFQVYITNIHTIDIKQFVTDLYCSNRPISYGGNTIYPKQLQNELIDSGSVLYNCISGLLIKQILKLSNRTFIVYHFIKQIAQLCNQNSPNQWIQFLADSFHTLKQKKYNEEQIVPNIQIKTQNLIKIFNILLSNMKKSSLASNQELNTINLKQQLGVDLGLIIDNLIIDAIGIVNPTNSQLYPNSGESIHLLEHKIKKVQAYSKSKNSKVFCLKKIFNMDYQPLFSHKNQQLPSWLKIKIEKQLITLYGIPPQGQNYSKTKICIFDSNECIIREVILEIQSSKTNNIKSKFYITDDEADSIIDTDQISPQFKYGSSELRDKSKIKMYESIQSEQNQTKYTENQQMLPKNLFRVLSFDQYNQEWQLSTKVDSSLQRNNIQQLNRKIVKSINPFLTPNESICE